MPMLLSLIICPIKGLGNVTIAVRDVNDNPPVFERDEYKVAVAETMPRDSPVLTLVARDDDDEAVDNHFTYSLLDPDPAKAEYFYLTTEAISSNDVATGGGRRVGVLRIKKVDFWINELIVEFYKPKGKRYSILIRHSTGDVNFPSAHPFNVLMTCLCELQNFHPTVAILLKTMKCLLHFKLVQIFLLCITSLPPKQFAPGIIMFLPPPGAAVLAPRQCCG